MWDGIIILEPVLDKGLHNSTVYKGTLDNHVPQTLKNAYTVYGACVAVIDRREGTPYFPEDDQG